MTAETIGGMSIVLNGSADDTMVSDTAAVSLSFFVEEETSKLCTQSREAPSESDICHGSLGTVGGYRLSNRGREAPLSVQCVFDDGGPQMILPAITPPSSADC